MVKQIAPNPLLKMRKWLGAVLLSALSYCVRLAKSSET